MQKVLYKSTKPERKRNRKIQIVSRELVFDFEIFVIKFFFFLQRAKDLEINQERNEIEKIKRSLQRELQDLQFDLEKQRNELKTEFDEVMRKREHEWRLQSDEYDTKLLAKDLEVKLNNNLRYNGNSIYQYTINSIDDNFWFIIVQYF